MQRIKFVPRGVGFIHLSAFILLLGASQAQARCGSYDAGSWLLKRFTECTGVKAERGIDKVIWTDPRFELIGNKVQDICKKYGCANQSQSGDKLNNPNECSEKYAAALALGEDWIPSVAADQGCKDSGPYIPAAKGCVWSVNPTVQKGTPLFAEMFEADTGKCPDYKGPKRYCAGFVSCNGKPAELMACEASGTELDPKCPPADECVSPGINKLNHSKLKIKAESVGAEAGYQGSKLIKLGLNGQNGCVGSVPDHGGSSLSGCANENCADASHCAKDNCINPSQDDPGEPVPYAKQPKAKREKQPKAKPGAGKGDANGNTGN